MNLFENIKNVTFEGFCDIQESETTLPVYSLIDIPVDTWNEMAKKQQGGASLYDKRGLLQKA